MSFLVKEKVIVVGFIVGVILVVDVVGCLPLSSGFPHRFFGFFVLVLVSASVCAVESSCFALHGTVLVVDIGLETVTRIVRVTINIVEAFAEAFALVGVASVFAKGIVLVDLLSIVGGNNTVGASVVPVAFFVDAAEAGVDGLSLGEGGSVNVALCVTAAKFGKCVAVKALFAECALGMSVDCHAIKLALVCFASHWAPRGGSRSRIGSGVRSGVLCHLASVAGKRRAAAGNAVVAFSASTFVCVVSIPS